MYVYLSHILYDFCLPLFIVENGFGAIDTLEKDGSCHDPYREEYLKPHIQQMKKAVEEDGVELMGSPGGCIDLVSFTTGELKNAMVLSMWTRTMMADELAEEVDFFSLGINDLTQYTLAIDRQNPKLENFCNAHHPAVLRMIRHTVEAGHRHGCWVGICGELGADPTLTGIFLRMGLDELSVSPSAVLPLRKLIRGMDLSKGTENQ